MNLAQHSSSSPRLSQLLGLLFVLVVAVSRAEAAARPDPRPSVIRRLVTSDTSREPSVRVFATENAARAFSQVPVGNASAVSSTFGPRWQYAQTRDDFHRGVDYFGAIGDRISAMADGAVFQVHREIDGTFPGGGNVVVIEHALAAVAVAGATFHDRNITKCYTYYLHLSAIDPAMVAGASVLRGARVGAMGNTGTTDFTHLHFEVRLNGYCSLEYQVDQNRSASPTSSCFTGFDPHVHPFIFVSEAANQTTTTSNHSSGAPQQLLERTVDLLNATEFDSSSSRASRLLVALRYCSPRGHLDLDVIEGNLGRLAFNTREGMNRGTTLAVLDNVSYIAPGFSIRPLEFQSTTVGSICYDVGVYRPTTHISGTPLTFVAFYDINGRGVRVDVNGQLDQPSGPPQQGSGAVNTDPSGFALLVNAAAGLILICVLCMF